MISPTDAWKKLSNVLDEALAEIYVDRDAAKRDAREWLAALKPSPDPLCIYCGQRIPTYWTCDDCRYNEGEALLNMNGERHR